MSLTRFFSHFWTFDTLKQQSKVDDWQFQHPEPKLETHNYSHFISDNYYLWIAITVTLLIIIAPIISLYFKKEKNKFTKCCVIEFITTIVVILVLFALGHYLIYGQIIPAEQSNQNYLGINVGTTGSSLPRINMVRLVRNSLPETIGYSTGGAKDINNFRQNINNSYLPLPTDITYEGLFYDYYFHTGLKASTKECNELFCPSYSYAISDNPLTNESEYYLSVGLNSGIKQNNFKRKKLNLVVVLDISGSMDAKFDRYYYDTKFEGGESLTSKSKQEVANEAIVGLIEHLNDDDRFGMVVFNSKAYLAKPLNLVGITDINAIKQHILELKSHGGTNFEDGYKKGTQLFENIKFDSQFDNRIIYLTDAMPNTGDLDEEYLLGMAKN